MKIYFMFHTATKDSETGMASGWNDVGLSQKGIQQAKELGEVFKNITVDLIYCSDLARAIDTAKIAFGEKIPIIPDKRLRGANYGDYNGKPREVVRSMQISRIKEPYPNGESYEQATVRLHEFLRELKENHPDKAVVIIGHNTKYGLDTFVGDITLEDCLSASLKPQMYWEYDI